MERVIGIGGVFFKAKDQAGLRAWYREHLGMDVAEQGYCVFNWTEGQTPERPGTTHWSLFTEGSSYFDPTKQPFMINYRVRNLDAMLKQLRDLGDPVEDKVDDSEFGRFGWVMDPEGNKVELWEPPEGM